MSRKVKEGDDFRYIGRPRKVKEGQGRPSEVMVLDTKEVKEGQGRSSNVPMMSHYDPYYTVSL